MKLDLTLKILRDILEKTDITNVDVTDALDPIHVEIDEETLEPKEDQEIVLEYDLTLKADLSHADIQAIDEFLANYSNVEMRLRDGNMEIFERFGEKGDSQQ